MSAAFRPSPGSEPLPIFPLGTVLYPGGALPLRIFETRYVDMTRDCLKRRRPFGVCLIRDGREVGQPATPYAVGCLAHIVDCDMPQFGVMQLRTRGEQRFRILNHSVNPQGLILAEVALFDEEPVSPLPEEFGNCAKLVELTIARLGPERFPAPHRLDDAAWVAYRLAEILPLPLRTRQSLLELPDAIARLAVLQQMLTGTKASER